MAGNDDQSLALQLRGLGQSDEAAVGFPSGVDIRHDDQTLHFRSFQDIASFIATLQSDDDKVEILAELATQFADVALRAEYLLLKLGDIVDDTIGTNKNMKTSFELKAAVYCDLRVQAKTGRQLKNAQLRLNKLSQPQPGVAGEDPILPCPRKKAIIEYCRQHLSSSGHTTFESLAKLLAAKSGKEVVVAVNTRILKRISVSKHAYTRTPVRPADINATWSTKEKKVGRNANKELEYEKIKRSDMKQFSLRYSACGLLEPGRFDPLQPFPEFPGEDASTIDATPEEDVQTIGFGGVELQQIDAASSAAAKPATEPTDETVVEPAAMSALPKLGFGEPRLIAEEQKLADEVEVAKKKAADENAKPLPPRKKDKKDKTGKGLGRGTRDSKYSGVQQTSSGRATGNVLKRKYKAPVELDCRCPFYAKHSRLHLTWQFALLNFETLEFPHQRELLKPIVDYANASLLERRSFPMMPCPVYVEMLAECIGMIYTVDLEEFANRAKKVWEVTTGRKSFGQAILDRDTFQFFDRSNPVVREIRSKYTLRITHQPLPVAPFPRVSKWLHPKMKDLLTHRPESTGALATGMIMYFGEPEPKIFGMLREEFEMIRHHLKGGSELSGELRGAYYTLAAQLIHANPILWLMHFQFSGERAYLWHPQPARYIAPNEKLESYEYFGSFDFSTSRALYGTYVLSGETKGHDELDVLKVFADRVKLDRLARSELESRQFIDLKDESAQGKEFKKVVEGEVNRQNLRVLTCALRQGEVLLYRDGATVSRDWKPSKLRIDIPISFDRVISNKETETGSSVLELRQALIDQRKPDTTRFEVGSTNEFPISVQLQNLGPIWDMVRGVLKPDNPVFLREARRWVQATEDELGLMKKEWIATALVEVEKAFETLKATEKDTFGQDSFWYQKEHPGIVKTATTVESVETVVIPDDMQVISDRYQAQLQNEANELFEVAQDYEREQRKLGRISGFVSELTEEEETLIELERLSSKLWTDEEKEFGEEELEIYHQQALYRLGNLRHQIATREKGAGVDATNSNQPSPEPANQSGGQCSHRSGTVSPTTLQQQQADQEQLHRMADTFSETVRSGARSDAELEEAIRRE